MFEGGTLVMLLVAAIFGVLIGVGFIVLTGIAIGKALRDLARDDFHFVHDEEEEW